MGRRPRGPRGGVRPTAQRVRTALFDHLGAAVVGADVLDLFAGTGGLGLEALARGARRAVFVERDARLARRLRERVQALGGDAEAQVWPATVSTALRGLAEEGRRFDLIVLDPPYGRGLLQETLDALAAGRLLRPGGRVVAEGHWRETPRPPAAFACVWTARYGETGVWEFVWKEETDGEDRHLSGDV